jgi:mono/diheme cytochrome c family protein
MKQTPKNLPQLCIALSLAALIFATPALASSKKEDELAGAALFRDKGCSYCHGVTGLGTKKGPPLTTVRKKLKAPEIAAQIKNGGQKMPPFDTLSEAEIAQLVSYLRAKHRPAPPPEATPALTPSSPPVSNPTQ